MNDRWYDLVVKDDVVSDHVEENGVIVESIDFGVTNVEESEMAVLVERKGDLEMKDDFCERIIADMNTMSLAPSIPGKVDPVPAGNYVCLITDAQVKDQSEGSGFLVIVNMVIIAGESKGLNLTKYYNLTTQKSLDFFKKEMASIGFVVTGSAQLPGLTKSLSGVNVRATVTLSETGNRSIYLKAASTPAKAPEVKNQLVW